jgi:hypothetical protein
VSDRREWLSEWCPECRAAPGLRCRRSQLSKSQLAVRLHVARGWRARSCPTCKAWPGEPCRTPRGRESSLVHTGRLRAGRRELLWGSAVWAELEQRGAAVAVVPFASRAGRGGTTDTITLRHIDGEELGRHHRQTRRQAVRGDGLASGRCGSLSHHAGWLSVLQARGPPSPIALGDGKDRAATRSSRI